MPVDEAIKTAPIQFVDIAWFLSRGRFKVQRQNETNQKLGNRDATFRISVNTPYRRPKIRCLSGQKYCRCFDIEFSIVERQISKLFHSWENMMAKPDEAHRLQLSYFDICFKNYRGRRANVPFRRNFKKQLRNENLLFNC